jgi:outer membrane receptor protein involved in Fe transport
MQIYGCDLNGLPFKDKLPMKGVAKNAANFALHYDSGGFSGRLAYNWNSRTLIGMSTGGGGWCGDNWCPNGVSADPANAGAKTTWWSLPVYQEAYGQWDLGGNYEVNKKFSVSFSVSNIANVVVRETVEQTPGVMGHVWRYPGQNYNLSARYEF